jgi:WD40 repeat protein
VVGPGNEVREVVPVPDNATSVDFVDDRRIAIGVLTGQTILRDLPPYPETYSGSAVYGSGWAAGSPKAAVASLAEQGYNVGIWDVETPLQPTEIARITTAPAGGRGSGAADISPAGDVVAAATMDGSLVGWDVSDSTQPAQMFALEVTDTLIEQVKYAGEDTILLPADDGYVHVVRTDGAKTSVTQRLGPVPGHQFLSTATPDLSLVASGGSAGQVSIWRPAESTEPIGVIEWEGYLYAVAVSPDGSRLAVSGSPKEVRIYDISDPSSPELVGTRSGANGTTFAMEYSVNGQLAAVSNDGTVMLWAADDGSARAATIAQPTSLFHLGWSPEGTHFIAGGSDGFARIFPADPSTAREELCAGIGDHLTREQWTAAVPDLQMPRLCD